MNLRDELLENEDAAQKAYFSATGLRPDQHRNGFFHTLLNDADIAYYIVHGQSSPDSARREAFYAQHGFKTCREILERHKDEFDPNKTSDVHQLKEGDKLNTYQISALSQNYNTQIGMYSCHREFLKPYIILKSEIGGDNYHDHWVDRPYSYYYCMQSEKPENTMEPSFVHSGNVALFNDLIRHNLTIPALPVYLFVRNKSSGDLNYTFEGVFNANSMLDNNTAFQLVRSIIVVHADDEKGRIFERERQEFLYHYLSKDINSIVGKRLIEETTRLEPGKANKQIKEYYESDFKARDQEIHDYFEDAKMYKKIGELGEQMILAYERSRVARFAPEKVSSVKPAADICGYDLLSYRQNGSSAAPVHIEVKTTVETDPFSPFFMSSNENHHMQNDSDYWLYRVYNVNAVNPKFYAIRGNVDKRIDKQPRDYSCVIIPRPFG